ncbi:hypothetical protein [Massilia sp. Dwa41.01b]|uniref:tetratricopeptide repeat protein n=1 Tax=Massilia sp. Dwa41.01b TaxID=2709302 RepID=UPI002803FDC4|nr:hypothetical protein [Massilia sp. Dwa41.01b]
MLLPTYQLVAGGKLREAIRSATAAEIAHPRHALDLARLRAELHASLDEHAQAEETYRKVLAHRSLGWAGLGLARAEFARGRLDAARATLGALIGANPRLMAAYDLLARCHEAAGDAAGAQKVLEEAVAISPHLVRRLRKLGEVALAAGDAASAEKSFKQVVARARYSEFRDPEDHLRLVQALVRRGDAVQASGVVRDLERSLRAGPELDACLNIANAALHEAAGNKGAALAGLQAAVAAVRSATTLSTGLKLGLVRSCLAHRLDAGPGSDAGGDERCRQRRHPGGRRARLRRGRPARTGRRRPQAAQGTGAHPAGRGRREAQHGRRARRRAEPVGGAAPGAERPAGDDRRGRRRAAPDRRARLGSPAGRSVRCPAR